MPYKDRDKRRQYYRDYRRRHRKSRADVKGHRAPQQARKDQILTALRKANKALLPPEIAAAISLSTDVTRRYLADLRAIAALYWERRPLPTGGIFYVYSAVPFSELPEDARGIRYGESLEDDSDDGVFRAIDEAIRTREERWRRK